ncbi:hypothetical protein PYCC9005_000843 [Savitreella phatthalungensis]
MTQSQPSRDLSTNGHSSSTVPPSEPSPASSPSKSRKAPVAFGASVLPGDGSSMLPYMHLLESLKTTKRTGWINESIPLPESIADHMYRMAMITMMIRDKSIDRHRLLQLALVHDLAEAIVGDITPMDEIPKARKQAMEAAAMDRIALELVPQTTHADRGRELVALFEEYEGRTTAEARLVKDIDKYELVLQTFEYERRHEGTKRLDSFVVADRQIEHHEVKVWVEEALAEREAWWASRSPALVLPPKRSAEIVEEVVSTLTNGHAPP